MWLAYDNEYLFYINQLTTSYLTYGPWVSEVGYSIFKFEYAHFSVRGINVTKWLGTQSLFVFLELH